MDLDSVGGGSCAYDNTSLLLTDPLRLIVLGTGDTTIRFIKKCANEAYIELIGNIPDFSLPKVQVTDYSDQIASIGCRILPFEENVLNKADLIFSIEYRRILPLEFVEKYHFVNCHGGILPKWRGLSCNAWAIMNGENEIGYSIHRMNGRLDDGALYFVKKIPIAFNETYADVHKKMTESIVEEMPLLLYQIGRKRVYPVGQEGSFAYCNKFTPGMGELTTFNRTSLSIYNLYRCMAKPLGSGIFFIYKRQKYDVGKVEIGSKFGLIDYEGIVGKIVNIYDEAIWVKTKDNAVVLSEISSNGEQVRVSDMFKIGNILGNELQ